MKHNVLSLNRTDTEIGRNKRVFDLVKDLGTSQSSKIDSIFESLLCPNCPAYVTIPYCTSTVSCSYTTPS
ncbi:MAG: hypothetical protein KZQ62_12695 [Candidatus Thiodiazotropha sp. (ex Lucinoma aequizonata)]|nr:hypothetical protein [Candidatus Thiodiazotropha sp. (ex Lucinoma aequizonata)]MCU7900347.1 hypothetical protein [Candidatus Thiodiazotropha sp. (ex Lucinoma aequizonata)]